MMKRFRVDPRDVHAADFPKDGTTREKMLFLLNFAILAPSIHNTQPWKFSVERHRIGIFADRMRWLKVADPDKRDLRMSLGCVLENLLVAARHFGYAPELTYAPRASSPDFMAMVDLSRPAPPRKRDEALLDALKRRHMNYRATDSRPVMPSLLEDLSKACSGGDAELFTTREIAVKSAAAQLYRQASAVQFADAGFCTELAEWLRRGEHGLPRMLPRVARLAMPQLKRAAEKEAQLIEAAPVFGAILSAKNDAVAQLRAGQAFERVWLAAARRGVSLRPASALCEVPAVKAELARLLAVGGLYIQQPFRLGFAPTRGARAPRRQVGESIISIPLH